MGKKKPEEMAAHRELFEQGALKKGYDPKVAVKLFDLMELFAGYGFNKSHSAAYALIAYHTAWLKAHHPAEFLAATLSSDMDDTDKVQIFWRDCLANGITVLPPDINTSAYRFEPVADAATQEGLPPRTIRYGMGAVKGTGQGAVEEILRARQAGPFTSLFDFCRRIDRRAVNKRSIEALIRVGAFDAVEPNRGALVASLGTALEAAEQHDRSANQVSLFGDDSHEVVAVELASIAPWSLHTRLSEEKTALGFFFSGHLFDVWRDEVRLFAAKPLVRLEPLRDSQWIAGVICDLRTMMTSKGKLQFVTIDDGSAQVEVTVYAEIFEQHRNRLREDQLVIMQVKVTNNEHSKGTRIVAENVYDLQLAREARAKALRIRLNGNADAILLKKMLSPFRVNAETTARGTPVEVLYENAGLACTLRLDDSWRVRLSDSLVEQLTTWTSSADVEVAY
jgi:DNA polymerase-3 subunit alpha